MRSTLHALPQLWLIEIVSVCDSTPAHATLVVMSRTLLGFDYGGQPLGRTVFSTWWYQPLGTKMVSPGPWLTTMGWASANRGNSAGSTARMSLT